jgi:hypothetical protein
MPVQWPVTADNQFKFVDENGDVVEYWCYFPSTGWYKVPKEVGEKWTTYTVREWTQFTVTVTR